MTNKNYYGIYGCFNEDNELVYIGHSSLEIAGVEYNHRHWRQKDYKVTFFRAMLEQSGRLWTFKWIQPPRICFKRQIDIEEGALIRFCKTRYNDDKFPYETAILRGRYDPIT